MTGLYGLVKLEDIDITENKALLEMINARNNNLQLEFCIQLCDIVDLFKYYISKNSEHIVDIDSYDCIDIEIIKDRDNILFTLNASDDDEDIYDIKFLEKELKRLFGVSLLNCKIEKVLNVLLTDCKSYSIEGDILKLNIYYENFKETWIGEFLNSQNE